MNWSTIRWILGVVWMALAGILLLPLLLAVWWDEPWRPFGLASATGLAVGSAFVAVSRSGDRALHHRDAFLIVSLVWLSACALGALPLYLHPSLELAAVDALFEAVSGFTTTGATVLSGLDSLPGSVLLWRSMTQWLGGMGIVVFGVAILPLLGVGGLQLYKAEAPGPEKDKLTPRIAETARLLWVLYLGLTVAATLAYYAAGMTAFEALNHALTTVATGGFSTHDSSLGYYESNTIYLLATVFMLAAGTSFALLRRMLTGRPFWRAQPELRAYAGIFVAVTLLITLDLLLASPPTYGSATDALAQAALQTSSILTTTGYATADFDAWPGVSRTALFALFLVGGMAGSTAGGPKVVRVILLLKVALLQFVKLAHPRAVVVVQFGTQTVEERALVGSVGFMGMWMLLLGVGTVGLAAGGADLVTAVSAAATCLGNVGPGFAAVGPANTFASFDTGSKLLLEALMLCGRLELYTLLVVLTPGFWRF